MKLLITGMLFSLSFQVYSSEKVVYGVDDRKDIFESSSVLYKKLAISTAAMISNNQLEEQADGSVQVTGMTLEEDGICSDARFAKQVAGANCSGFLVGDQYLVTAGHCIESLSDCSNYTWAFGFSNDQSEKSKHNLDKKDLYTCTEIISRSLDRATMDDFALVKLDRKVSDRAPLTFRKTGKIKTKAKIVVIGHPSGLPTKIADGAIVRENKSKYFFQATLDTFGGNSGSAVFDEKTGVVEGILVRGETDYESAPGKGCLRPKVCKATECRGEDVTRITNIKELMKLRL